MNGLKLFSENYINGDCGFTFSYDAGAGETAYANASQAYLYDQKQATQYLGEYDSDTTSEFVDIVFKNWQGEEVNRAIDRLVLLNHNIKALTAYSWDGSAWAAIAGGTLSANTAANNIIEFTASVTASRLRVKLDTTQTANQFKLIGELKACLSVLEDALWDSSFPRNDDKQGGSYRLSEGPLVTWKEWTKVAGTLSLNNVTPANTATLMPYMKTAAFLTVVFHDDFDLAECYEFSVVSAPRLKLDRKTELYSVSMELDER
jgi:hypothetical protein